MCDFIMVLGPCRQIVVKTLLPQIDKPNKINGFQT